MSYFSYHIFCCDNRREDSHTRGCCASKGSAELRDYLKDRVKALGLAGTGKVRVNKSGCLDRCELGAVIVVYPEEVWYHIDTKSDIDEIITSHLQGGTPIERLRLSEKQKRL